MTRTYSLPLVGLRLSLSVVALSTLLAGAAPAADRVTITPQQAWSAARRSR